MNFHSVQALRGVAAIFVLLMHARIAVWWAKDLWEIPFISKHGMIGVSLFFCISGFIIAHVVSKTEFNPKEFAVKRFWRIAPVYWIVTVLALIFWATANFWNADMQRLGWQGVVKSFLMLPQQGFPLVNPGWSLEHELIFYALAALIVPYFRLAGLFTVLVGLWVVGRFYSSWDYHLFSYCQLYFALGIAAYWMRGASAKILLPIAIIFMGLTISSLYKWVSVPSTVAIIFTALGCSFAISSLVSLERSGLVPPAWLVKVGDASYSIYIVHWILLPWIGKAAYHLGGSLEAWRWAAFAICMLVGFASRKYLEIPLMRFRFSRSRLRVDGNQIY